MVAPDLDDISSWRYNLPAELIASRPAAKRDDSRLMIVRRDSGRIEHAKIRDLPDLLSADDLLIFNNTKVLPARLFGFRTSTRGKWEGLFLEQLADAHWKITGQTRGKLTAGESITLISAHQPGRNHRDQRRQSKTALQLKLVECFADGTWRVLPSRPGDAISLLEQFGTLPLPPYIGRKVADAADQTRYQTIFAHEPGAIAAPTAGLHFTPELLRRCAEHGITSSEVTLHVGIGTFRPVSSQKLSEHEMHSEWGHVPKTSADSIASARTAGGKIVAVGTTCVRTVEAAAEQGRLANWHGSTNLFIKPGFKFTVTDQLLTNFHLPGSTLLVLVAALAGYDLTMEAYRQAVAEQYRFYSYGDAMLIL
ncbi:MAG: tRNA preQ1(34) S-adenosylmethionine ribosyltransferase-isomerase QueA [Fuerstiella sp.]|nr:tRNA preQ1(34) S-adenosylmethionine ribosyltransferase-isomerase QueA [Fuerstiella sp.]MCP4506021.1 tRNA preQ1(34) S-adenosylmethionine ribosyltransferase-isomerase QueA [Fuerstiella sp.]